MQRMDITQDIIRPMTLAPSAHNTQPWKLAVNGGAVDVYVDWSRHLDVSDPTQRQLYVSLGCAIENGVVAAEHVGFSCAVSYFPEGEDKDKPAARLTFTRSPVGPANVNTLFAAIPRRRNDRSRYDSKPLTDAERSVLKTAQDTNVVFIEDDVKRSELAEVSAKGTWETLSRKDFKTELSQWVRSSLTKQHDGMPGDAMGMPAPIALIAPFVAKNAPIHKMQTPEVKKQIATSAAVAIITTSEDTNVARMQAGQMLERLWLEAAAAGLAASVIAAAIESGETVRSQLRTVINTQHYPQTMLRIGHSKAKHLKPTPRRTVNECLVTI